MTTKRTIAIVAGGDSGEYEVSLRSAEGITSFLDKELYTVYTVIIRGTEWNVQLPDGTTAPIDRNDFSFTYEGEHVKFDYAQAVEPLKDSDRKHFVRPSFDID